MKHLNALIISLILFISAFAQPPHRMHNFYSQLEPGKGIILGKVVDANNKPMQYVTITLFKLPDSTVVDGTLTDSLGRFILKNEPFATYALEAKFIGFEKKLITNIKLSPKQRFIKIGKIVLAQQSQQIKQVVVTAQQQQVQYKVDKKVINVSQALASKGGTAVDILQNIPSVDVDIQGNVSLRGSSNFTVLINGKPSVLEGSEALQQIPASEIKRIEIITNPSAKYDPDGIAGIINIITKRPSSKGINGNVSISYDNYNAWRANAILNLQVKKFNFFIGFDRMDRVRPAQLISTRIISMDNSKNIFNINGNMAFRRIGWGIKSGFNYYINKNNTLSFSARLGRRAFLMNSFNNSSQIFIQNSDTLHKLFYTQTGFTNAGGWMYQADLDFQHNFNNNDKHYIRSYLYFASWSPTKINTSIIDTTDQNWNSINSPQFQQKSTELRSGGKARFQIDYQLPMHNHHKLQAGYSARYFFMSSNYSFATSLVNQNYTSNISELSNFMKMTRLINAAYFTYSGKLKDFLSYQLGLRTEWVNRTIYVQNNNSKYSINRIDFFPSIHLAHNFSQKFQIEFGYSRRIHRPTGWILNPFPMYLDQHTIQQGNPNLLPEYTNSLELNLIKYFNRSFLSIETFYRQTINKFQRIQKPINNYQVAFTTINAGQSQTAGAELAINFRPLKFININASSSFYYYQILGTIDNQQINKSTFSWNSKLMLMSFLPTGTMLQIMAFYRAPTVTLQGYRKGFLMSSFAVKQAFFKRKLNLTLSVSDPFKLAKFSFTNQTDNLYSSSEFILKSPQIMLTLDFRINNYKPQRNKQKQDIISDFEGEGIY